MLGQPNDDKPDYLRLLMESQHNLLLQALGGDHDVENDDDILRGLNEPKTLLCSRDL
jgi:hypothetical protein